MPGFAEISVRQPQPYDLVDDPVAIAGVGTGFEGVFTARVRDDAGNELATVPIYAGGTGIWGNFHVAVALGGPPATPQGTVEVFQSGGSDGTTQLFTVVVPVTFGTALVADYHGFSQYTVVSGDTLSGIASQWYGDANLWSRLFEANRDQISNPNLIFPGQVLRVPQ